MLYIHICNSEGPFSLKKIKGLKLNIKSLRHRVRKCFMINMFNTCIIDNHIDNQANTCIPCQKFNTNVHW